MPSWYAIAALADARDATEDLLRPFDRGQWLRLALVTLFVGVGGGVPTGGGGNAGVPSGGGGAPPGGAPSVPDLGSVVAILAAIAVVALLLLLLWNVVGAVMEFVLIAGLRDRDVRIREPFRTNVRRGLRLFGFRIAVGLGSLLVIGVPIGLVFALGFGFSPVLLLLLLPLLAVFGVVALLGSVVLGLTTDFVVPTMLTENRGVLDGWGRVWPILREQWRQTAVYVVAKFVLGIGVSLVVSLAVLLAALLVAVPFALVGGGLYFALSAAGAGVVTWVVVGLLIALYALLMLVVGLLVQVPALTFVRYYSLSVLGMFDPDLDLVGVDRPDEGDGPSADDGGGSSAAVGADDGDQTADADQTATFAHVTSPIATVAGAPLPGPPGTYRSGS